MENVQYLTYFSVQYYVVWRNVLHDEYFDVRVDSKVAHLRRYRANAIQACSVGSIHFRDVVMVDFKSAFSGHTGMTYASDASGIC